MIYISSPRLYLQRASLHKLVALLSHDRRTSLRIQEEIFAFDNICLLDTAWSPVDARKYARRRQELQRVSHADLAAMLGDLIESPIRDVEAFCSCAESDDRLDLIGRVGVGGDDEKAGEEVLRNAVGSGDVVGAADDGVSAVRGEDNDGRDGGFKGAVQVGEAFDVKHMDLRQLAAPCTAYENIPRR